MGNFAGSGKAQMVRDGNGANFAVLPDDINLLQHLRELKWGEITVQVKNGRPVMGQRIHEDRKYSDDTRANVG